MTGEVEVEPDRARRDRSGGRGGARPATSSLIAGKGHEQGQESAGKTVPFDDREVARDALRRLGARA